MVPQEVIDTGVIEEEGAVELVVAAVVGEEGRHEVLEWLKPQIDRGGLLLGMNGAP